MEKIWLKNYPQNVPHEIDPSRYADLLALFEESCSKYGEKSAFENMGVSITFSELDTLTQEFAAYLQNHTNLKPGDRIAIQMPNLLQFPIVMFGALRAGMIVVNTNPLYTAREMKHQFNDSGAKAIVILSNFAHVLEDILSETPIETLIVTNIGDLLGWPKSLIVNCVVKYVKKMVPKYNLPKALSLMEALDLGKESIYTRPQIQSEDTAFLQYTGGTTGVSKGAMLTHRNIVANVLQVRSWMEYKLEEGNETIVTALPLYHIFSLSANCLALMSFGATNLLITNPKDLPVFIKTLRKSRFTIMSGVNTLYNALMNHPEFNTVDCSSLKLSVAGGMALQQVVAEKWTQITKAPIVEGFGLTETSPVACVNPLDENNRVGTIGLPVPSTEIKVVNDDNKELPIGESGELCIKGPQVMKGYWQRPEETANIMLEDGWLKTGDIAIIDEDGFAKIIDRKKDMILVSGFNVFPNEVEDVVATHIKVLEVAAIGVPDQKSGEVVKIVVVPKDKTLTQDELITHCKDHLAGYKVPKQVEFREELPKTNVGKILRRALKEG